VRRICNRSEETTAVSAYFIDWLGEDEDLVIGNSEDDLDLKMNEDDDEESEEVKKPKRRLLQKNSAKDRTKQSGKTQG
jgi:hypothetical protein